MDRMLAAVAVLPLVAAVETAGHWDPSMVAGGGGGGMLIIDWGPTVGAYYDLPNGIGLTILSKFIPTPHIMVFKKLLVLLVLQMEQE